MQCCIDKLLKPAMTDSIHKRDSGDSQVSDSTLHMLEALRPITFTGAVLQTSCGITKAAAEPAPMPLDLDS